MKKIILILVLVVRLLGSDGEEIGIPYIKKGSGVIDSAVLAPIGKKFYTLKQGVITYWQLEPLKKIDSFKVPIEEGSCKVKQFIKPSPCNISITSNEKKMILRSKENILLFDLEKKLLIKKVKHKSIYGVIDGEHYITFDTNNWIKKDDKATLWDINNNIKKIKQIKYTGFCKKMSEDKEYQAEVRDVGEFKCDNTIKSILILSDMVIMIYKDHIILKSEDTLKILKIFTYGTGDVSFLDYDNQMIDFYNYEGHSKIFKKINLHNRQKKSNKKLKPALIKLHGSAPLISITESLVLKRTRLHNYFFQILSSKRNQKWEKNYIMFHQYDNGEAVLIASKRYKKLKNHFELTSNARKYLQMKAASGKIVPINNKTFNKYNTIIKF